MYQLTIAGIVVVLTLGLGYSCTKATTSEVVTFTPTQAERVTVGAGDSQTSEYRVFTDDEVFENVDSLFLLKFDSSDEQNVLIQAARADQVCEATAYGWRVEFLSMYRNLDNVICD